jgi:hypothetical protein
VSQEPERQLTEGQVGLITAELQRSRAALAEARPLVDMPQGRILVRRDEHMDADLALAQDLRSPAALLGLEVLLLAQQGRADAGLATCRGVLNAGRAVGDEPLRMMTLVRLDLQKLALERIERCLAQGEPSESALSAVQQLLEDEARQPLLLQLARDERAFADEQMAALLEGRRNPGQPAGRSGRPPALVFSAGPDELYLTLSGSARSARAEHLRLMTDAVEAAKLPEWQQATAFAPFNRWMGMAPVTVRQSFVSLARTADSWPQSLALLRSGVVALAVERYRHEHGRWPNTLAELVPAQLEKIPPDPFDGNPIRYRRLPDGVVVYSVGVDGVDNGGALDRRNPRRLGVDVGLRLWDVANRRQPAPPSPNGGDDGRPVPGVPAPPRP